MSTFIKLCLILISCYTISSCQSYDFTKRVIQQGNLLPAAKIKRLHIGMNKNDVAILMGSSLLNPLFNEQRWDYVYRKQQGQQGRLSYSKLSIYFIDDKISKIEYDTNDDKYT